MSQLRELMLNYLAVREHTNNSKNGVDAANFTLGEAAELAVAAKAHAKSQGEEDGRTTHYAILYEIADVAISLASTAEFHGTTVEHCIELKTRKDRGGRG